MIFMDEKESGGLDRWSDDQPESWRDRRYWLVYLYRYEPEEPMGFLWSPVGLVEHRQTWQNWWKRVQEGEIELPGVYDSDGWWVSDRPITFGLYESREAGKLEYPDSGGSDE